MKSLSDFPFLDRIAIQASIVRHSRPLTKAPYPVAPFPLNPIASVWDFWVNRK